MAEAFVRRMESLGARQASAQRGIMPTARVGTQTARPKKLMRKILFSMLLAVGLTTGCKACFTTRACGESVSPV